MTASTAATASSPAPSDTRIPDGKRHHVRAVGFLGLTSVCFATLDTLSKYSGAFVPVTQALWVRYGIQALLMTLWWAVFLRPRHGLAFFRTAHPRFHVIRGLLLVSATAICFVGLRRMPVGEFTAVSFLAPMFAMVLSGWLLKEYVASAQWWCVALAFIGALIVIRPGADVFGWAVLFPVSAALCNSFFQLLTRRLASADEHPVLAQCIVGWVGTLVFAVPLLWPGTWTNDVSALGWAVLLAMGVFGTLGHFFLMKALALDTAPALAPYSYVQIVFAMVGGWILFSHTPDFWAVIGMLVIGLSGFVAGVLRARRAGRSVPAA